MTKLSVNLNKIALLRNSRDSNFPRLLDFANLCISAGAHGLTIHPRPDQRHARFSDVDDLAELVLRHKNIELNIEGNPTEDFLDIVLQARPTQCTLVPDAPDQLTSDHGWDVHKHGDRLRKPGQIVSSCIQNPMLRLMIVIMLNQSLHNLAERHGWHRNWVWE